ncbi:MAG: nucleotidyl transferase AbiEii/AbiGii toxin family protein [Deltaproteobacteria bacterium]|nr:nucleotidyl transferase AbiEii/AbiGii toxin family protein [Deltaproteobacteria bacterium]
MHDAIRSMLDRYECRSRDDYVNALREILQDVALLGLWRSKFFEHAAFYGGTALRVLYGLDRYSEDLDFSLLKPDESFSLKAYGDALLREISSFGFQVEFESRRKTQTSAIESAFLKTNTYRQLILIETTQELLRDLHPAKNLKIRLEVDTDPPSGFETEIQYVLQPIPFSVRVYSLPDLFAGKLHAILCRKWKTRVKGRDWYDLVWYAGRYPKVRISHLESRMRQSGDYRDDEPLTPDRLHHLLRQTVEDLDVEQARREVAPFVVDQRALGLWSQDFFRQIIPRIISI